MTSLLAKQFMSHIPKSPNGSFFKENAQHYRRAVAKFSINGTPCSKTGQWRKG
jgi:hypothetical protein